MKHLIRSALFGIVLFLAGVGILSAFSALTIQKVLAGAALAGVAVYCFKRFPNPESSKRKYAKAAKQSKKRYAKQAEKLGLTVHSNRTAGLAKSEKVSAANLIVIDGKKR